jgi:uncharacterized small protein (DUF1192 family)
MTDDIVTRLEHDLFQASRDAKTEQKRLLLERALNVVRVAEQRRKREETMTDEIERLRAEVSRLQLLANLWEAEYNAAVDELIRKKDRNG